MRNRCTILMLHRLKTAELNVEQGQDPEILRRGLELLRRRKYSFLSLEEVFNKLGAGEQLPSRAVVFTQDDGYLEQAVIAAPIFEAYDCPATTFVTSGFLDRKLWFWWDRIGYVFRNASNRRVSIDTEDEQIALDWTEKSDLPRCEADLIAKCKTLPSSSVDELIAEFAIQSEVSLPDLAPDGFKPMDWDQLRAAEQQGMTFGPHTVTHPILANCTETASDYEIETSWQRVAQEADRPCKVFCYPNGRLIDFGQREVLKLERLGFLGAVVGAPGFARTKQNGSLFEVRRIPFPDDQINLIQYTSGLESMKMMLRGMNSCR